MPQKSFLLGPLDPDDKDITFLPNTAKYTVLGFREPQISQTYQCHIPRCRHTKAWARTICPQRSMHPQPLSVVIPVSPIWTKPRRYVNHNLERMSSRIISKSEKSYSEGKR